MKRIKLLYREAQRGLHDTAVGYILVVGSLFIINFVIYLIGGLR